MLMRMILNQEPSQRAASQSPKIMKAAKAPLTPLAKEGKIRNGRKDQERRKGPQERRMEGVEEDFE
ncbi:hypothetical protein DV515_00009397 [Chloebia gouldiae]|uniref:Uncharacterized protein n=1 Tax=Chloebia gouldiae TaxID=44316 RepID=A0A3L8SD12_CHLGU|nr:hypothetical protein DV515_00009397 [Chloebia gouldiae]